MNELVKSLAAETAKATEEIETQIGDIQNVSKTTAEAAEEQSAATVEVSSNIIGVQSAASETGQSSSSMLDVAQWLSKNSEDLLERVTDFLQNVRAM